MRGISKRIVALPAAAGAALALVAVGAGAAHADVTSGTVSLTVNTSWVAQLAKAGVAVIPQDYSTLTYNNTNGTLTVTYAVTGGDANLQNGAGSLNVSGGILGFSLRGKVVSLNSLELDLGNAQFDGATAASGETPLVDLGGTEDGTVGGGTTFFEASDLTLDPAGAALLNSALSTKAFVAGESIGSFSTTWVG